MMEYKGYIGRVTGLDERQGIFSGEVVGITDVVTFPGKTPVELLRAFRDSVDDYLAFCDKCASKPDKPFSGKFLVRIPPDLHKQTALAAKKGGTSMNSWVAAAIEAHLPEEAPEKRPTATNPSRAGHVRAMGD